MMKKNLNRLFFLLTVFTSIPLLVVSNAYAVSSVLTIESVSIEEAYNAVNMQFVVTLSEAAATDVTVDYQTIGGTAIEGVDFTAAAGILKIAAGETSSIITISVAGGNGSEMDESFTLELTNPDGAVFAGDAVTLQAQGVILDNDGTGNKRALLVGDAQILENDSDQSEAAFEVRLSQPSTETVTLTYTTRAATAEAGSDYEAVTDTITFLPGETVKTVFVEVNGDDVVEGSEQFSLVVTPTTEIANGADGAAGIATIIDDDAGGDVVPALSIRAAEVTEAYHNVNMQFVVTLSEAAATDITVDYQTISGTAIERIDFTAASGTLTIAAGETSGIITISVAGGDVSEADESLILALTNPDGVVFAGNATSLQATGMILDNDGSDEKLALLVGDVQILEGNDGQNETVFEVRLSQASDMDITVDYTTLSGSAQFEEDFAPTTGTITFLAGQTIAAVHVPVYGDTAVEASEQFSLVLSSPEGTNFGAGTAGIEATATILDDDAGTTQPVISIAASGCVEAYHNTVMEFAVTLSAPSTETVQVAYTTDDGSALVGNDYIAKSGTLIFEPGKTSAIITVSILGGNTAEANEAFTLELSSPVNAVLAGDVETLGATGTIVDDDNESVTDGLPQITVDDIVAQEAEGGATATFTILLSSASAIEASGAFSVEAGTATALEDFTPVSGTFTFEPGQTSTTVTVEIAEDAIVEDTETIVLRLDILKNAAFKNGSDQLLSTGKILDQGNLAPVANDDLFTTNEDGSVNGNVLDNDSGVNGDTLTVVAVERMDAVGQTIALESGALLTLNADGSFDYDPNGQFDGLAVGDIATNSFTYTITGSYGAQSLATASIHVLGNSSETLLPQVSIESVSIQEAYYSVNMQFVVTLSEVVTTDVAVDYQTIGGTAIEGVDVTAATDTLTIAAGETTGVITISVAGGNGSEVDEFFTLELSNPVDSSFPDDTLTLRATGVILDDDGTDNKLALWVGDARILEGDSGVREAVFEVRLSQAPVEMVTLDYTTTDGSALAGIDYEALAGSLTFEPDGDLVQDIRVSVSGDLTVEGTESFSLTVNPTSTIANGVAAATGTATILDDDAGDGEMPVLSICAAEVTEAYNAVNMQFVVTLSEAATTDVTVDYQTIGGTAIEGIDFTEAASTLTIAAGETSGIITISAAGGDVSEMDESFTLELTNPDGAVFAGGAVILQAQGVILDNDGTGNKRALLVGDAQILENDSGQSEAAFEVRLSQPSTETVTLTYTTRAATAEAGSDYETVTDTITFLPGETVKTVFVEVNGDDVVEGSEQFSLVVTPTTEIANGADGAAGVAMILDDDAGGDVMPALSIRAAEVTEAYHNVNMQFVVTLSEAAATDITVDYQTISGTAIERSDFTAASSTLTVAAGETSGIITLSVAGGDVSEADESLILELTNPDGVVFAGNATSLQATGMILDNDGSDEKLALLVSEVQILEGNDGQSEAVFEVRLSQASDMDITVDYTTLSGSAQFGEDFAPTTGTIIFLAGQTIAAVHVPVYGDTVVEASEQFSLVLSSPVGAGFGAGAAGVEATATILDDDSGTTRPVINIAASGCVEAYHNTVMEFVVTLSAPSTETVQVAYTTADGSALVGSDYTAKSDTLTFAPGETSAVITVSILGGNTAEANEAFTLELSSPVNGVLAGDVETLAATGTIFDDDGSTGNDGLPVLSTSNIQVQEASGGATAVFTLTLSDVSASEVTGDFSVEAGTVTAGQDFTPISGTFSFDPGEISTTVTVAIAQDLIAESTETIVLRLDNLENASFSNASEQLLAICEILDQGNLAPVADDDAFTTDENTAISGNVLDNDLCANGDTLTVVAVEGMEAVGQTIALESGALLTLNADGSFDYDPNSKFDELAVGESASDTFEYTVSDDRGGQDTAQVTITFTGINDAPVGYEDAFTGVENTDLSGNVFDDNGSGADVDPEGDTITAELKTQASNGTVVLNQDGNFIYTTDDFIGTDTFTYTLSDGEKTSSPITVTLNITENTIVDPAPFSTNLVLPESLSAGETGTATLTYTNDSSRSYDGILVQVKITGGLLVDPQTGLYSNSLLLLGLGDGEGKIKSGESGIFELDMKLVSYPGQKARVTSSVIDLIQTIDWASQKDTLKPEFLSGDAWDQIFSTFQDAVGDTGYTLVKALVENAVFLSDYGVDGSNASTALAFELEQAADYGTLAQRTADGSLGSGWAFIGDLRLEISETTGKIALRGTTDLGALFALKSENSAYYIVSSSVNKTVGLGGAMLNAAPSNYPTFGQNIYGNYVTSGNFDGELTQTENGFQIETDAGLIINFDKQGKFIKAVTPIGLETTANYDDEGKISGLAGPFERTLAITRDGETGQVKSIEDSFGTTVELSFTIDQLTGAAMTAGTTAFTYDTNGSLASAVISGGPVTAFSYDDASRLKSVDVGSGTEVSTYDYDSLGGYTITDGVGNITDVALAPSGSLMAVTNGLGQTTSLLYSETGKLNGVLLADGSVVNITVDEQERITVITDPEGSTVSYTYEESSLKPATFTDTNSNTRIFTHNELGQMTSAEWPDGTSLDFTYDEDGNLETDTKRSGVSITYSHDGQGHLIAESNGTSGPADYTYDSAGNLLSATTSEGSTDLSYNEAGYVTRIDYPNGMSLSYTHDEAGRRASMIDQDGNVQYYTYDEAGRLAALNNTDGLLVAYTYDGAGKLIQEKNGNGTVTTYSYDEAGQMLQITNLNPGGYENSHVTYTYNELGQRISMETQDGTWTYGYDNSGQLISAGFVSTNPEITDKSIQYNYDAAGNRSSVIEDGVATNYAVNELNQYTTVGVDTYNYDDNGNLISKIDADGVWTYTYGVENRLISVVSPSGNVTEYKYDIFGNRSAVIENGVQTSYLVDPFGLDTVINEYNNNGEIVATYAQGLGLVARLGADGSEGYYDTDSVYSVIGITDASGNLVNSYVYSPFGKELFESEAIDNGYEFNGGLGVHEDSNDLTYMRARYYDSENGRFISEDPLWVDGDPANLYRFAYNDPNRFVDSSGKDPKTSEEKQKELERQKKAEEAKAKEYNDYIKKHSPTSAQIAEAEPEWLKDNQNASTIKRGELPLQIKSDGSQLDSQTTNLNLIEPGSGNPPSEQFEDVFDALSKKNESVGNVSSSPTLTSILKGTVWGDPHLVTFDNLAYDFQGAGEFTLVQGADLEIQIRTKPYGSSQSVTVATAIAMQVGDAKVGIYTNYPRKININDKFVGLELGETIDIDGGGVYRSGTNLFVITNEHGDVIKLHVNGGYLNVYPFLSEDRAGVVSGLLGNADGDRSNDIALPDGTVFTRPVAANNLYGDYADAWRVTNETSLFFYEEGESTSTYTIANFPLKVVTVDDLDSDVRIAAEQIARDAGLVEGTPEFDAAVLDVALTQDASFAETTEAITDPEDPADVLVVQKAPEPLDDTAEVHENHSVWIDVLANDTDPEGDALQIVSANDPNDGTIEISNSGLLYTPPANFIGVATLTYDVADGAGNTSSAKVLVTVLLDPLGDKDGDGLLNHEEIDLGTDPYDTDTDQDAFDDYTETQQSTSPTDAHSKPNLPPPYGDMDQDDDVDGADLAVFISSLGKSLGDPGHNAHADINNDDVIDSKDLEKLRRIFGHSYQN